MHPNRATLYLLYTSLCTGELNAIRKHKCFLCSHFGRACRWSMMGELKPKGFQGPSLCISLSRSLSLSLPLSLFVSPSCVCVCVKTLAWGWNKILNLRKRRPTGIRVLYQNNWPCIDCLPRRMELTGRVQSRRERRHSHNPFAAPTSSETREAESYFPLTPGKTGLTSKRRFLSSLFLCHVKCETPLFTTCLSLAVPADFKN